MKKLRFIVYSAIILFGVFTVSCKSGVKGDFNNSGGKPYELIVSINDDMWKGEVGDTLRAVMLQPVAMLNQVEPIFDVKRVNPGALKDIVLHHRNILIINIDPKAGKSSASAQYNIYARPQVIVTLTGPDNNSLVRYMVDNRSELQQIFEMSERDRAVEVNKKYGEAGISKDVYQMFGINMSFPKGFSIRNTNGKDFIWIGNDVRTAIQGVVIYSYPYTGKDDFTLQSMVAHRNESLARVPGPSDGSYMVTSEYIEPEVTYSVIKGKQWAEMRGFWDVANDFMGGPFVSYATLDNATGRVVMIDCFVYSPKEPKRNFLRQLEHIAYSAEFPSQTAIGK